MYDTSDEQCVKPIVTQNWSGTTKFKNPWPTWRNRSKFKVLRYNVLDTDYSKIPKKEELEVMLPIVTGDATKFEEPLPCGMRMMWIGHSTVLLQFDGITLITDPVFSSNVLFHSRYRPPACKVNELPEINAVLISHNHYDHLDTPSVRDLNGRFGDKLRWYAPLGLKSWLNSAGCNNVVEMNWWLEETFPGNEKIRFCSVPAQHWSKRGPWDDFSTLWCGWSVIGPRHSFYFAGATGYCDVFKQIGRKYGPFTLAAIPIGCYEPRDLLSPEHINTEEAVKIHEDVRAQQSLGIHWGTFKLSHEFYLEPKVRLPVLMERENLKPEHFFTLKHGEVKIVKDTDGWNGEVKVVKDTDGQNGKVKVTKDTDGQNGEVKVTKDTDGQNGEVKVVKDTDGQNGEITVTKDTDGQNEEVKVTKDTDGQNGEVKVANDTASNTAHRNYALQ